MLWIRYDSANIAPQTSRWKQVNLLHQLAGKVVHDVQRLLILGISRYQGSEGIVTAFCHRDHMETERYAMRTCKNEDSSCSTRHHKIQITCLHTQRALHTCTYTHGCLAYIVSRYTYVFVHMDASTHLQDCPGECPNFLRQWSSDSFSVHLPLSTFSMCGYTPRCSSCGIP